MFLLSGSVGLLALHSFPTRRSSDLTTAMREQSVEERLAPALLPRLDDVAARLEREALTEVSASRSSRDRKSTRLNSSHVAITYAVFCLKKETTADEA